MSEPALSEAKRWALAIAVLLTTALVVAGQLMISFEIGFKHVGQLSAHTTLRYNLWTGAWHLYKQNLKFLAALVVVWSGVWPLTKLLGLLILCVHPAMTPKHQHRLIWVLSACGKWALLDLCLVGIILVSVSFSAMVGWAQAVALEGTFVLATGIALSQLLTGAVSWSYPSQTTATALKFQSASAHAKHAIRVRAVAWVLPLLVLALVLLLAWAQSIPVLDLRYKFQVLGVEMEIDGRTLTMPQIWRHIWDNPRLSLSNHSLAPVLFISVCVLPIVHAVSLLALSVVVSLQLIQSGPLSQSQSSALSHPRPKPSRWCRRLRVLCFALRRWTLHEVFLAGLAVITLELSHVAASLSDALEIVATVRDGAWFLLLAVLLEALCVFLVGSMADELEKSRTILHADEYQSLLEPAEEGEGLAIFSRTAQ
eukprot:c6199_g1_i1.p1 GENE.c6199_g1_i1~~c6199_g1_i1.p1  ORF type:complete len:425 (+),score=62.22 c6199_g1_i1:33-1307(+)